MLASTKFGTAIPIVAQANQVPDHDPQKPLAFARAEATSAIRATAPLAISMKKGVGSAGQALGSEP